VEDDARELLSVAGSSDTVWLNSEGVPEGTAGRVPSDADSTEAVRIVAVSGASELLAMGEYLLPFTDASDCSTSMDTPNAIEDDIVLPSLDRGYSRLEDMSRFASDSRLLGRFTSDSTNTEEVVDIEGTLEAGSDIEVAETNCARL